MRVPQICGDMSTIALYIHRTSELVCGSRASSTIGFVAWFEVREIKWGGSVVPAESSPQSVLCSSDSHPLRA